MKAYFPEYISIHEGPSFYEKWHFDLFLFTYFCVECQSRRPNSYKGQDMNMYCVPNVFSHFLLSHYCVACNKNVKVFLLLFFNIESICTSSTKQNDWRPTLRTMASSSALGNQEEHSTTLIDLSPFLLCPTAKCLATRTQVKSEANRCQFASLYPDQLKDTF